MNQQQTINNTINSDHKYFHISKVRNRKQWTTSDDVKLIHLAKQFGERHWKTIALNFPKKNALQCFSRYKRIRPGIVQGHWSEHEDNKIKQLVNVYGYAWSKIAKVMQTRNGKQIRDRYMNVLNPKFSKKKFTDDEDRKLIQMYMKYGPCWSFVAKFFPLRTADMIKNRFHSSIKKLFYNENVPTRQQMKTLMRLRMKKEIENENNCNITTTVSTCGSSGYNTPTDKNKINFVCAFSINKEDKDEGNNTKRKGCDGLTVEQIVPTVEVCVEQRNCEFNEGITFGNNNVDSNETVIDDDSDNNNNSNNDNNDINIEIGNDIIDNNYYSIHNYNFFTGINFNYLDCM